MRVFSKKNFTFSNPETGETFRLRALDFAELPEWAKTDPLFGWAIQEESLEVFGEEKTAKTRNRQKPKESPGTDNDDGDLEVGAE